MTNTRSTDVRLATGAAAPAIQSRLAALDEAKYAERLWKKDPSLWGDDPEHRKVAANRLGWLDSPRGMKARVTELNAFVKEVAADGYTHAVLLGMGGSSLAPEVFSLTYAKQRGALELTVLDNTSPAAVRAVADAHDPKKTLFIVSSKSGGTIEVKSFEAYFYAWVKAASGSGRSFVAVTDPGTALEKLAATRGYRRVFTNPPDIGGRYSALSYFGLVPAALIGVDLDALLDRAIEEAGASGAGSAAREIFGVHLGAALGELAKQDRDKLTIVPGAPFAAFGSWAEQLVAESTGKSGRGIVPVAEEDLAGPDAYGNDRVFVSFAAGPLGSGVSAKLDALEHAGHPVLRWRDPDVHMLAAEFLRWEIATAVAGSVTGVDPFDEPNVTEAKNATAAVLDRYVASGAYPDPNPVATADGLVVEVPDAVAAEMRRTAGDDPARWVAALLTLAKPGDYFAVLAYLHRTEARHARLQKLRHAARASSRLATTLGYGPRFLHSTGQLHKGGANNGIFLQLTADEGDELPIPGERYGFGALRWAQAAGDYEVLEKRGRRVMRIRLGRNVERGLDRIIGAVEATARA